jgi:hypothetical protein
MQPENNPKPMRRWRRMQLAAHWGISDRTIDRMRRDGRLGPPVGFIGKIPLFSDEQRQAAERAAPQLADTAA